MIPNLITIVRLFLVPLTVMAMATREWSMAFSAFVVAGVSDALDGFIARHFNMKTELGAYLDPIADKSLLVSAFVTLSIIGEVPAWLTISVVFRDLLIVGAIILCWVLEKPMAIRPLMISKINTAVQLAYIGAILGFHAHEALSVRLLGPEWERWAAIMVAGLTFVSALAYLAQWLEHLGPDQKEDLF
jgi:cardiolipin synthase